MCDRSLKYLGIKSINISKMVDNYQGVYFQMTLKHFNKVSKKRIRWIKFRKMIEFFVVLIF